jgi:hypothetical protein
VIKEEEMKKLLVAIIGGLLCVSVAFAGVMDEMAVRNPVRGDNGIPGHYAIIPYCIHTAGFITGINISTDTQSYETECYIGLFNNGEMYSFRKVRLTPAGLTAVIDQFCEPGVEFRSPSTMGVAVLGSGDSNRFWVTQFTFTGSGFSHQIIESKEGH